MSAKPDTFKVLQSFDSPTISLQTFQRPIVTFLLPWNNSSLYHSFPAMAVMESNAPKNITSSIAILVIKTIAIFRIWFSYTTTSCSWCIQYWIFFQLRYCHINIGILFVFSVSSSEAILRINFVKVLLIFNTIRKI